jgi:hypothetical protein
MSESQAIQKLTILDWVGITFVIFQIIGLFAFPKLALAFKDMFTDFGGPLPLLTRVVIKPWFSILVGIVCSGVFLLQLLDPIKSRIGRRRTVIVLSFLVALAGYAICIVGLYLPIFKIAGSISV